MSAVKVVRFLSGPPGLADDLRALWGRALGAGPGASAAPGGPAAAGRPVRVALGVPLTLPELAPPPYAAVDVQWFASSAAALANDPWLQGTAPDLALDAPPLAAGSCRVVADEVVLRGADYLAARWRAGGDRYKMLSFGRRNPELTPEEFSARWRGEAGRLGAEQIPEDVRGEAYVQNHPVARDGPEWPLDAVNEVWFDRLDLLRRRGAWLAARQDEALRSGAVGFLSPTEVWSIAVREVVLTAPGGDDGLELDCRSPGLVP